MKSGPVLFGAGTPSAVVSGTYIRANDVVVAAVSSAVGQGIESFRIGTPHCNAKTRSWPARLYRSYKCYVETVVC